MVSRELSAIAVLAADLERARRGLEEAHATVLGERPAGAEVPEDAKTLAFLAVALTQYYNALEDLVERSARVFEGAIAGESWHAELLRRATLDLPGLRPAIVPAESHSDASTLLKFRHFLRHAYAVKLDAAKLSGVIDCLYRLHPVLEEALTELRTFLESLLAGAEA